jgi:hypothetical protein
MNMKRVLVWVLVAGFAAFSSGVALAEDGMKMVKYPEG